MPAHIKSKYIDTLEEPFFEYFNPVNYEEVLTDRTVPDSSRSTTPSILTEEDDDYLGEEDVQTVISDVKSINSDMVVQLSSDEMSIVDSEHIGEPSSLSHEPPRPISVSPPPAPPPLPPSITITNINLIPPNPPNLPNKSQVVPLMSLNLTQISQLGNNTTNISFGNQGTITTTHHINIPMLQETPVCRQKGKKRKNFENRWQQNKFNPQNNVYQQPPPQNYPNYQQPNNMNFTPAQRMLPTLNLCNNPGPMNITPQQGLCNNSSLMSNNTSHQQGFSGGSNCYQQPPPPIYNQPFGTNNNQPFPNPQPMYNQTPYQNMSMSNNCTQNSAPPNNILLNPNQPPPPTPLAYIRFNPNQPPPTSFTINSGNQQQTYNFQRQCWSFNNNSYRS
uniref:Uncharacterized protein n=1 Tax=Rhabditophanes sp. KR3021 TaxID=114890 RepID=A0AC35TGE9_9BILA